MMVAAINVRLTCLLWLAPIIAVHGFVTPLARNVVGAGRPKRSPASPQTRADRHRGARWHHNSCRGAVTTTKLYQSSSWEGDDLRWTSKLRRRWFSGQRRGGSGGRPVTATWCLVSFLLYGYQVFDTVAAIRRQYPHVWPSQALQVVLDVLLGTARMGPLTVQLAATTANSYQMLHREPYRFVTAALAHGSLIHWGLATYALLRQLPPYLESELGSGLFATVFLMSSVFGHWFALAASAQGSATEAYLLGGTTGLAGLYGLLFVCLARMGNPATTKQVGKGIGYVGFADYRMRALCCVDFLLTPSPVFLLRMIIISLLFLYGTFLANLSNVAHIGGFIGGAVLAMVAAPRYRPSYAFRRKKSLAADPINSRQYRSAMGYDTMPTRPLVPWPWLWVVAALFVASKWHLYQSMPQMVWTILCRPIMGV
jgi:membrane associated rhomboid family serine protease